MNKQLIGTMFALATTLIATHVVAQDIGTVDPQQLNNVMPKRPYSPYAGRSFSTRVYWGDTHLHTGFSMDAGAFGARLNARRCVSFRQGRRDHGIERPTREAVPAARLPRRHGSLRRHGLLPDRDVGNPEVLADPQGKRWHDMIQSGDGATAAVEIIRTFGLNEMPKSIFPAPGTKPYRNAWRADDQGGRASQRSGSIHGVHRLRVDLERRRQQSAPQRHLP